MSTFYLIPNEIKINNNISSNAKMLFADIVNLAKTEGYCWAGNAYFAKAYNTTKRTIQKWIAQLKQEGFCTVEIVYEEDKKTVKDRKIFLTEKTKKIINNINKINIKVKETTIGESHKSNQKNNIQNKIEEKKEKIEIQEPLKLRFLEKLKSEFEGISDKEAKDILNSLADRKNCGEYLEEKIKFVKESVNVKSPIGLLITAIKKDLKPSLCKVNKDNQNNNLKIHTRHHEIEQTFSKYNEKELEKLLLKSQESKFGKNESLDDERINKLREVGWDNLYKFEKQIISYRLKSGEIKESELGVSKEIIEKIKEFE